MVKLADSNGIANARRGQGRMYDLPHVVLCCILAVAAGADSYRAIVRFIDARLEWLREHTRLGWRRAPSHAGLRLILLGLDQEAIEQALHRRACAALDEDGALPQGLTVALDGKTLRGSLECFADHAPLQWLSALENFNLGLYAPTAVDLEGGKPIVFCVHRCSRPSGWPKPTAKSAWPAPALCRFPR